MEPPPTKSFHFRTLLSTLPGEAPAKNAKRFAHFFAGQEGNYSAVTKVGFGAAEGMLVTTVSSSVRMMLVEPLRFAESP